MPRTSAYVFPNEDGKPFANIHKGYNAAVRRAEIGHVTFHHLRHNFASHLVINGVNLVTVKELLGHSDISTTMRYAHLDNRQMREAVEKSPAVDSENGHYMDTRLGLIRNNRVVSSE